MYNTSQNYKDKILNDSTQHELNIYIDNNKIEPNHIIDFKITLELFNNDEFCLGSTPEIDVEFEIDKRDLPNNYNEVYIESGLEDEIVPIGKFTIQSVEDDEFKVKIKATDYMKKFEDNKYDGSDLTYPATMLQVLQDICTKIGVELGSTSFLNSDKQISVYDNTVSARTYLSYIAEQAEGFAVIGRDGKLYIKTFELQKREKIAEGKNINFTSPIAEKIIIEKLEGSSTQTTRSEKNLFNGTLKAGLFLASDGVTFVQNNNYVCSEKFISVINGETYSVSNKNEIAGIYYVLEYDENKNFIKASNNSANAASFKTTISSNCCYVRVEIGNSSAAPTVATIEDFQIEKGEVTEYEKYGASPSQNYPSPIENVEGKNIFDISKYADISLWEKTTNYFMFTPILNEDMTKFKNVLSGRMVLKGTAQNLVFGLTTEKVTPTKKLRILNNGNLQNTSYDFKNADNIYLVIGNGNMISTDKSEIGLIFNNYNIMINKGTVATDYVPYNSLEIKDVGENLLNVTAKTTTAQGITFTVNADKSITINGTNTGTGTAFFRLADNFVLPAGNYTLSNKNSNASNYGFLFYDDGNNFPRTNISNATFTEDTTIKPYIRIDAGITVNNQTIYPIILKGTYTEENIPAYTPYQEQKGDFPLSEGQKLYKRSYLANNGIHHKRKQFEIDVTQIRAVTSYNNIDYASIPKPADFIGYNNYAYYEILCNKAISQKITSWDNTENINKISSQAEKTKIYLGFEKGTTLEQMKTALANTVIEYDLAEEETIPYTTKQQEAWEKIKNLKLFEGVNNIASEGKIILYSAAKIELRLFKNYKWGEKFKVSKVFYEDGVQDYKFGDETASTIYINQNNMYIVDSEQVKRIYTQIKDFEVSSFEGETIIDPAYDIGDILIIDGKRVLYQGELEYAGKFKANIKSNIQAKTEQESMQTKQSNSNKIKRVQSEINQIDGKITQLAQETKENSKKISKHEQTLESISDKVSNIEDLTNNVEGVKTIALANCVEGKLLELHVYGNNTVFDYLFPGDDLYPSDNLYPRGDSRIIVSDKDNNQTIYDLGVLDVLRQNGEVYDEFILEKRTSKSYS